MAASEYHLRAAERWLRGLAPEPSCPASTTAALQRAMEEPTVGVRPGSQGVPDGGWVDGNNNSMVPPLLEWYSIAYGG